MERHRPLSCIFELTYKCNFRCPMCYVRMNDEDAKPYGMLRTADEWIDMARQAREAGVLYFVLTGGECTTFPGFAKLYKAAWKMGFRISIMSNAGAYTDEIRELFGKYKPYGVSITLYGGSDETYEKVTGDPHGLTKVLENVSFLRSVGIPVQFSYTITKQNVHDYPLIGKISAMTGIAYTLITDLTPHRYGQQFSSVLECRLSPAERACVAMHSPLEVETALENAKELEKELVSYRQPIVRPDVKPDDRSCIGSKTSCAIYWNGNMNTCISLGGDVGYKPFEIGFEAAWQALQANRAESFRPSPVCSSCEMIDDCVHSCPARNFEGMHDRMPPDPSLCQYVWLLRKYKEKHNAEPTPRAEM